MEDNLKHSEDLREIRSIMERSTKFISLSGLSGILAGIAGLIAVVFAIIKLNTCMLSSEVILSIRGQIGLQLYFLFLGLFTLSAAIFCAVFFTIKKARQKGLAVWDKTSQRFLFNLFLPLITGGIFILAMALNGYFDLICASMLIFFGLSLINASKYTHDEILYLGILEIVLGLAASFFSQYGILLWGIGFGVLNIIYGSLMFNQESGS